jgi:hypothetical protein
LSAALKALLVANARRKIAERKAWLSPRHSEERPFNDLSLPSPGWYLLPHLSLCWYL